MTETTFKNKSLKWYGWNVLIYDGRHGFDVVACKVGSYYGYGWSVKMTEPMFQAGSEFSIPWNMTEEEADKILSRVPPDLKVVHTYCDEGAGVDYFLVF